jgi:DNA-binding response OmpR family regulator
MSSERILIVDDDESIRQVVRLCLMDEGFEVREAPNGQAALDALDEFQPELILLDLRMPVMDGREFARRYESVSGAHAPIIAFVAALNAEQECANLTTAGILTKPFDLDDLLKAVRSQLAVAT